MSSYVDIGALVRVLLYSLGAAVVVTVAFAVGARTLAYAEGARAANRPVRLAVAAAVVCFAGAAAAVAVGIWFVLDKH